MGDDAVLLVQVLFQLADNPVGVDGDFVRVEQVGPLAHPRVAKLGDLGSDLGLSFAAVGAGLGLDLLHQSLQG